VLPNAVRNFEIVDVFATGPYTGNQLAVVRDAEDATDEEMLAVAKEFGFSETTFVESEGEKPRVRIFTPAEEVNFAGHPTLGTAAVLLEDRKEVTLDLNVGPVPVREQEGVLWMKQNAPEFDETRDSEAVAEVLGIDATDIDDGYPVQEVSTGLPAVIVPLETLDAVRRVSLDRDAYDDFVAGGDAKLLHVFAPEAYEDENDLNARMFAPYYGVPEDPATGSANGCLGAYLVEHGYFDSPDVDVRVEQGYEIGRPSLVRVRASDDENGGSIDVRVGGKVERVAEGELV
jgi:trans-2,3-dihydro-3-hydroxyanthranilate isomerase